jgi:hypothetical protein
MNLHSEVYIFIKLSAVSVIRTKYTVCYALNETMVRDYETHDIAVGMNSSYYDG